jgi:hypothetical protein
MGEWEYTQQWRSAREDLPLGERKQTMKLTTEQHAEIAKHLHAADHHLMRVLNIMCPGTGSANVPIEIVDDIEEVREALGAATSASRQSIGSILDRCENVLFSEWPDSTFDVYHGSYGDCVTLALEQPYRPPAGE